jgi:type II secretory pathway component PulK
MKQSSLMIPALVLVNITTLISVVSIMIRYLRQVIYQKLLQQHQQQQTVSLAALMMMLRSLLTRATSEKHHKMSLARRFAEEAGLFESKTVEKQ